MSAWQGQPGKNRGGETTGDDRGKSELLHVDAFFFVERSGPVWFLRAGMTD